MHGPRPERVPSFKHRKAGTWKPQSEARQPTCRAASRAERGRGTALTTLGSGYETRVTCHLAVNHVASGSGTALRLGTERTRGHTAGERRHIFSTHIIKSLMRGRFGDILRSCP